MSNPITTYSYTPTFKSGDFHHAVLSISGTTHTLYLDGSLVQTNSIAPNIFDSITTVNQTLIGANYAFKQTFQGIIGDVRVYNQVVSATQVSNLYLNRNLIAHYPFDASVNKLTPNYATLQYDATIKGSPALTTGFIGNSALQLANTNTVGVSASQYIISNPGNNSWYFNNGLTISCWIKVDSSGNTNNIMRIFDIPYISSVDISGKTMIYSSVNYFNVKSISGLKLWLDASDPSTFTVISTTTTWKDKSGTTDFTNNVLLSSPLRTTYNGKDVIFFGKDKILNSSMSLTPSFTLFVVLKTSPHISGLDLILYTTGGTQPFYLVHFDNTLINYLNIGVNGGQNYEVSTGTLPETSLFLVTVQIDSTDINTNIVNINGNPNSSFNKKVSLPSTGSNYFIQSTSDTGINLSEMIIYSSALSLSNYKKVEGYLAWKWGLQTNLPIEHPYKNTLPV